MAEVCKGDDATSVQACLLRMNCSSSFLPVGWVCHGAQSLGPLGFDSIIYLPLNWESSGKAIHTSAAERLSDSCLQSQASWVSTLMLSSSGAWQDSQEGIVPQFPHL